MLTIDDPEIERLIREEAARTGEEPVELLRRALLRALPLAATERRQRSDDSPLETVVCGTESVYSRADLTSLRSPPSWSRISRCTSFHDT